MQAVAKIHAICIILSSLPSSLPNQSTEERRALFWCLSDRSSPFNTPRSYLSILGSEDVFQWRIWWIYFLESAISNAGISVWASQKEKTSFGPVMRSYLGSVHYNAKSSFTASKFSARRNGWTYLRNQSLEETRNTFILHHTSNNLESTLRVFEVAVLDTGLDDIEGSGTSSSKLME